MRVISTHRALALSAKKMRIKTALKLGGWGSPNSFAFKHSRYMFGPFECLARCWYCGYWAVSSSTWMRWPCGWIWRSYRTPKQRVGIWPFVCLLTVPKLTERARNRQNRCSLLEGWQSGGFCGRIGGKCSLISLVDRLVAPWHPLPLYMVDYCHIRRISTIFLPDYGLGKSTLQVGLLMTGLATVWNCCDIRRSLSQSLAWHSHYFWSRFLYQVCDPQ